MLNYIKSEIYRIINSPALYVTALCCGGAPLVINIILFIFLKVTPNFRYATTSFSYSNLVVDPMIYCVAAFLLVFVLYDSNKKNGNVKNVIAVGISREKLFFGQFIVCLLASIIMVVVALVSYIVSARLLLVHTGPVVEADLLHELVAVAPTAVASLLVSIAVITLFEQSIAGVVSWFCIFYLIPQFLSIIGMKVDSIYQIAMWLPRNFFAGMEVTMSVCNPLWNQPEGLAKCWIAGLVGIAVFAIIGVMGVRKKEF